MRKVLIPILFASVAATPAFAQQPERSDRQESRAERQQEREDRQQARDERKESREQAGTERAPAESQVRFDNGSASGEAVARADRRDVETIRATRDADRSQRIEKRQNRQEDLRTSRELRQAERQTPAVLRNRVPVVSNTPREGTQPPPRTEARHSNPAKWSTSWRHDSKYDWYNWRLRHRWLYNLGYYYDPFGWGYRPYSIGWRMWPSYYGSNYWLNDPWEYRLPYAPPGYRWIRYYDDAILIDTWNGQIVDVIYNFFW